jgi:hypothetical protein
MNGPEAARVELYADGVNGDGPVWQDMERVDQLGAATGGYLYSARVSAKRPAIQLYGARDTALWRRCRSSRICSNPVEALIWLLMEDQPGST